MRIMDSKRRLLVIAQAVLLSSYLEQYLCDDNNETIIWSTDLWSNYPNNTYTVPPKQSPFVILFEYPVGVSNQLPPTVLEVSVDDARQCRSGNATSRQMGYQMASSWYFNFTFRPDIYMEIGFIDLDYKSCNDGMRLIVQIDSPILLSQATTPISSKKSSKNSEPKGLALGLGIAGAFLMVVGLVVGMVVRKKYWHRMRKVDTGEFSPVKELSDLEFGGPHQFTFKDLSAATQSFSSKHVVGEGGFGTVYKGILRDTGSTVAVKRLSQYARQGAREFMAEVKIISQLRHRNLVQLLGWCYEKDELILVYEYMPNGDLDELIYADNPKCPLSWKQRFSILSGVATALVYLHEEWEQRVVHRDVKTSNVMLDSALNARLGDFGLARLSAHSQAPQSTLVAGTLGYLAPEFSLSGRATDKTDVYAFGVVALEVACARRPLTPDCILVDWVWDLHKDDKILEAIDPRLDVRSTDDETQMRTVLQVGLLCAHPDVAARPSMRQVLNILAGDAPMLRVPRSKPVAYYAEFA